MIMKDYERKFIDYRDKETWSIVVKLIKYRVVSRVDRKKS